MAWMERFREAGGCVFVGEDTHRDRQTVLQSSVFMSRDGRQGALCFAHVRPSIRLSVRPSVRRV